MSNKLKEVTYLTFKELKKENIVLPSKYIKVFEKNAKKINLDLENETTLFNDFNEDSEYLEKIVQDTNKNLDILRQSTSNAQNAIEHKDSETLKGISKELEKMKKEIKFLQKELFSDPLTKAYNRKWFLDCYLKDETFKNDGFIVFMDLDKFKGINDTYGHIVGDQVLKYFVKFLKKELDYPGVDIVRYAGDEFIALFNKEKNTILDIDLKMQNLQEKLKKQKLKSSKISSLYFSFSFGFLTFKKEQALESTLETVDELMYKDKQRNR